MSKVSHLRYSRSKRAKSTYRNTPTHNQCPASFRVTGAMLTSQSCSVMHDMSVTRLFFKKYSPQKLSGVKCRAFNSADFVRKHILDLAPYQPIVPFDVLSGHWLKL